MKWYRLTNYHYDLSRIIYSIWSMNVMEKTNHQLSVFNEARKEVFPQIIEGLEAVANCEKIKISEEERRNCIVVSKHVQIVNPDIFPGVFSEYILCKMVEDILFLFKRYGINEAHFPTHELQELLCGMVTVDQIMELKHKFLNPEEMDIESYKILKEYQEEATDNEILCDFVGSIFHFKFELLENGFRYNSERDVELEKIFSYILDKDIFRQKNNPTPLFLSDCDIVRGEIEKLRQSRLAHLADIQRKKDRRNAQRRKRYKEKKALERQNNEKR